MLYPTGSDLAAFLAPAGLDLDAFDLERLAAAGIAAFERATGRTFLAADGTRTFDPPTAPGGVLDLRADLAELTSVSYAGTALTVPAQVRALPLAGPPYDRLQFQRFHGMPALPWWSQLGQISVTGLWGYGETLPGDVFEAMLAQAALQVHAQALHAATGGLKVWREKDRSEDYGGGSWDALRAGWEDLVGAAVGAYRRVAVGLS